MSNAVKTIPTQFADAFSLCYANREKVDALNALAFDIQETDPRGGLTLCNEVTALISADDYPSGYALMLIRRARCHCNLADFAQSEACLRESLEISRAIGDACLEAKSLSGIGTAHQGRAEFPEALEDFQKALTLFADLDDPIGQAAASDGAGICYYNLGDLGQALHYSIEALKIRRRSQDRAALARSLNNLGMMHEEIGESQTAACYLEEGLKIAREIGATSPHVYTLINLAKSLNRLGRHQESIAAAQESLDAARQAGYRVHECRALIACGESRRAAGRMTEAMTWYGESLTLALDLADPNCEIEAHCLIGECQLAEGVLDEARGSYERVKALAAEYTMKHYAIQACLGLSSVCERTGRWEEAMAHHKTYHALEREVFSEAADRRAKALMIQMQVDAARQEARLHEQEAELHRIKNVELAQSLTALAEANAALEDANRIYQAQSELLQYQAEELHAQAQELEMQAMTDALTGLANRRHLEDCLAQHFAQSRRQDTPLTAVLIDIDHFKQINDRFGHQMGDFVLHTVADLLHSTCRASDLAARYGGEEFVLVLPDTDQAQGQILSERARQTVAAYDWQEVATGLSVTISLGVTDDQNACSYERLLAQADTLLYEAKRGGRNRVCSRPVLA